MNSNEKYHLRIESQNGAIHVSKDTFTKGPPVQVCDFYSAPPRWLAAALAEAT